jgi:hypothetical protein
MEKVNHEVGLFLFALHANHSVRQEENGVA